MTETNARQPPFLAALRRAYNEQRKSVVLLTGGVLDLFWEESLEGFVPLEQVLFHRLKDGFQVLRMDAATGIDFFVPETEREVAAVASWSDGLHPALVRDLQEFRDLIGTARNEPLTALVSLKHLAESFGQKLRVDVELRQESPDARAGTAARTKPLCLIMQCAGSLFPEGEYSRLSELDRQRLVLFLNWMADSKFLGSYALIILISDTRTEVNSKIVARPCTEHIEIQLPDVADRELFVADFIELHPGVQFEKGQERFVRDTAGLELTSIRDLLLAAERRGTALTQAQVVAEVNQILAAKLGGIIRVKQITHSPKDVIGYEKEGALFKEIFERCEDPETAVSAILVSGPNGSGKSYQAEAYAKESGRVVIEIAGVRSSYFGETDSFFEVLRLHLTTLGRTLILVDEAHTAFGSVHRSDTHETERRLAGNIIKMMGDPENLGKILWALMTSRPDELDPDVKRRAPIQIPIFDLEGAPRAAFVREMFLRKGFELEEVELTEVLARTEYYSAGDFRNLVAETLAKRKHGPVKVLDVLKSWRASTSIRQHREFQALVAAQHCSYPDLLPEPLRNAGEQEIEERVARLKWQLHGP